MKNTKGWWLFIIYKTFHLKKIKKIVNNKNYLR